MSTSNLYNGPLSPRQSSDSFQDFASTSKGFSFTLDNLNFTNVEREHFTDISSIPRVQDVSQPTIQKFSEAGSWNLINQTEIEKITRYYVPKQLTSSATERPNSELEKLRQENKMLKKCVEEKDDLLKGYATKVQNLEGQVAITWDLTEKLKRVSQENEELTETLKDRLGAFKGTLKQLESLESKLKIANQDKLKFQTLLEEKLKELEESKTEKVQLQKLFANKSKEVSDLSTQLTETEDKLVVTAQEQKRMTQSLVSSPLNRTREGSIKTFIVSSPKNSGQKTSSASSKKTVKKTSKTPKGSLSPTKEPKNKSVKIQIWRVEKPGLREDSSPLGKHHIPKAASRGSKTPNGVYLKKDFLNLTCKTAGSSRATSPKSASFVMSASSKGFNLRDDSPKSSILRSASVQTASFLCASPDSSTRSPVHTPVRISSNEEKKFSQQIAMLAELEEQQQQETEKAFVPVSRMINRRETVPVFNHPITEEDGEDVENTHRDYQGEFKRLVTEINTKVGIIWSENEALDMMVAEKNKDIEKLEEKIADIGFVEEKVTGIIEEKKNLLDLLQQRSKEVDSLKTELTEVQSSQEGYKQFILERERKQSLLAQKLNEAEMKMRGLSQVEGQLRVIVNRAQSVLISGENERLNTSLYSKKKSQSVKELEDDNSLTYNLKPYARSTLMDLDTERAKTMKDLECINPLLSIDHRNLGEPLFAKRGNEISKSQSSLYSETSTQSGPVCVSFAGLDSIQS